MSFSRRILLTLSSSIVARNFVRLIAIEKSIRKSCLYWIRTVSLQISSHDVATLSNNQFRFMTSVSYEYHSWTRTVANAFWTKISKSWFESIDFVKLFSMQRQMNISIKFDLDTFRAKAFYHKSFRTHRVEKINRFYYL